MQLLHTMLRVGNLDRSIEFYTKVMGMNLLRRTERPEQKYSLAFVGYEQGNISNQAEIELTYSHGVDAYELGTAYGHIALGVKDLYKTWKILELLAEQSRVNQALFREAIL